MEENGEHGYCLKQDCALGVGDISNILDVSRGSPRTMVKVALS